VHTIEVSAQVSGKFIRGQSGPFLDADTAYEEQRKSAVTMKRLAGCPSRLHQGGTNFNSVLR
jgi:hypothetical protein